MSDATNDCGVQGCNVGPDGTQAGWHCCCPDCFDRHCDIHCPDLHRAKVIQGLVRAAYWLAEHEVPVDRTVEISYSVTSRIDSDAEAVAEMACIAEAADTEVTGYGGAPLTGDETHSYVTVTFGPVQYKAIAITRDEMAAHHALMSYRHAVEPNGGESRG